MTILYSMLAGFIQGILEFFPVSSFGHIYLLEKMLYLNTDFSVLFGVFLHLGTLIPIIIMFRKDVLYTIMEYPGLFKDVIQNTFLYIRNRRHDTKQPYVRIIQTAYRKLAVMVLVTLIPTVLIGYTIRNLFFVWCETPVMPAIGFLMTGIVLLVVDYSRIQGTQNIKNVGMDHAMWMGIFQGLSFFPGMSRAGLTIGIGRLCGESMLFAFKLSYLSAIPVILGSSIYECTKISAMNLTGYDYGCCIIGMLTAALVGASVMRICLKIVKKVKFRYFAFYCFVLGCYMIKQIYL